MAFISRRKFAAFDAIILFGSQTTVVANHCWSFISPAEFSTLDAVIGFITATAKMCKMSCTATWFAAFDAAIFLAS